MANETIKDEDKILCAFSYAIGIPALYIMLTDKRKDKFTGYHGTQSLFLWIAYLVIWIVLWVLLGLILDIVYIPALEAAVKLVCLVMWVYALYCAYRAYMGETFSIPYITDFARKTGGIQ